uniref:Uncharacterized protein n=1 Tax=Glossina pallidipes TaxID=7398 RepID=A0A1A9ZFR2_GLOPL
MTNAPSESSAINCSEMKSASSSDDFLACDPFESYRNVVLTKPYHAVVGSRPRLISQGLRYERSKCWCLAKPANIHKTKTMHIRLLTFFIFLPATTAFLSYDDNFFLVFRKTRCNNNFLLCHDKFGIEWHCLRSKSHCLLLQKVNLNDGTSL